MPEREASNVLQKYHVFHGALFYWIEMEELGRERALRKQKNDQRERKRESAARKRTKSAEELTLPPSEVCNRYTKSKDDEMYKLNINWMIYTVWYKLYNIIEL